MQKKRSSRQESFNETQNSSSSNNVDVIVVSTHEEITNISYTPTSECSTSVSGIDEAHRFFISNLVVWDYYIEGFHQANNIARYCDLSCFRNDVMSNLTSSFFDKSSKKLSEARNPQSYIKRCLWTECIRIAVYHQRYATRYTTITEVCNISPYYASEYNLQCLSYADQEDCTALIDKCLSVIKDPVKRQLVRLKGSHLYEREYTHVKLIEDLHEFCAQNGYSIAFKLTPSNINLIYAREISKVRKFAKTINIAA